MFGRLVAGRVRPGLDLLVARFLCASIRYRAGLFADLKSEFPQRPPDLIDVVPL